MRRPIILVFVGVSKQMMQPTTLQISRTARSQCARRHLHPFENERTEIRHSAPGLRAVGSVMMFPFVDFSLNHPTSNRQKASGRSPRGKPVGGQRRLVGVRSSRRPTRRLFAYAWAGALQNGRAARSSDALTVRASHVPPSSRMRFAPRGQMHRI